MGRDARAGYSLTEVLVAGSLLLLLLQASWWTVASHARASSRLVEEGRVLDQVRLSRHILSTEVWNAAGSGALRVDLGAAYMRAFRGVGVACGGAGEQWWVAVAGARELAPEKDSILVLTAEGTWVPARVVRRSPADPALCPVLPGFEAERWVMDAPLEALTLARYYESTGFRFSDEALRMRSGGRWQPLTDLLFDDANTDITSTPARRIRALIRTLSLFGPGRERSWEFGGAS